MGNVNLLDTVGHIVVTRDSRGNIAISKWFGLSIPPASLQSRNKLPGKPGCIVEHSLCFTKSVYRKLISHKNNANGVYGVSEY